MKRRMIILTAMVGLIGVGVTTWAMAARAMYESAEYKVLEADGKIEIRQYPDLMLVSTRSEMDSQGRDGSFMRLFQYISGANEDKQKIAMTTPVFMEGKTSDAEVSMGFVLPKEVAANGVPDPQGAGVTIRKREGGRFAVIRFAGRLDKKLAKEQEATLRQWIKARGLKGATTSEAAGYDPPFTPQRLRRNEVLIRLDDADQTQTES
ncbi:SOUL heme-binding protein [Stieleria bergensis]|uniref:SOUL heme-binding protein n=1 Tax=Stieleria bergensis TaxID=2528025 RepID=A0A517T2V1_9BACT|nr:SOUL heme-binding protein [Planctomycetes bacterium SV_7m_r]